MLSADKVCLSGGWYLDSLKTTPGHFDGWDYYLQEPTDFEGTAAQKKLVMGGKARQRYRRLSCCRLCLASWFCVSCSWLMHSTFWIASVRRPVVHAHRRRCGESMSMLPTCSPVRGRALPASLSGSGRRPLSTMRTRQSHGCTSSAATCSRCAQSHATPHDIRDNVRPHSARLHDSSALKLTHS